MNSHNVFIERDLSKRTNRSSGGDELERPVEDLMNRETRVQEWGSNVLFLKITNFVCKFCFSLLTTELETTERERGSSKRWAVRGTKASASEVDEKFTEAGVELLTTEATDPE